MIEFRFLNGNTGQRVQPLNGRTFAASDKRVLAKAANPDGGQLSGFVNSNDPALSAKFAKLAPGAQASESEIRTEIERLQQEHKKLDHAIFRMSDGPNPDELTLRRAKKHKLQLKDLIVALQMQLVPDIRA